MELRANIKKVIIKTEKVLRSMDRKTAKALIAYGSYTRRTAMFSMKNRKKGSAPVGTPPYAKLKLIKKNIFYSYDEKSKSIIVGPAGFKKKSHGYNVVKTLEAGGVVTAVTRKEALVKRYGGNPYMKPAHDENLPKVIKAFGEL